MAQVVGYHEDNVQFTEGPFVATKIPEGWFRVEVEHKNANCPVLPDSSIYDFLKLTGLQTRGSLEEVSKTVDFLNESVGKQAITCQDSVWRA
jgi:hypothetical protein